MSRRNRGRRPTDQVNWTPSDYRKEEERIAEEERRERSSDRIFRAIFVLNSILIPLVLAFLGIKNRDTNQIETGLVWFFCIAPFVGVVGLVLILPFWAYNYFRGE